MIRDRKFHLRTYRRCMVGTEMVDWLLQQSPLVHSRTQAVGMWQALVEEGVVVHGESSQDSFLTQTYKCHFTKYSWMMSFIADVRMYSIFLF